MPAAIEISFQPGGEVPGWIRWSSADFAEVSGAIAGRDVEGSLKGDGQVSVIAAHADAFLVGFGCGASGARVFIAERDAIVDEVADPLHAVPARPCPSEQFPAHVDQPIALAKAAGAQETERFERKMLDRDLPGTERDWIRLATVAHDSLCGDANFAGRGDYAAAPVAKLVAVSGWQRRWCRNDVIWRFQISNSAVVDVERQEAWRRLGKPIGELATDPKFHDKLSELVIQLSCTVSVET